MKQIPDITFLEAVSRGDVTIMVHHRKGEMPQWSSPSGLLQIRRHEEAGYLTPMITAKWAGYPDRLYRGVAVLLTEKGKLALASDTYKRMQK